MRYTLVGLTGPARCGKDTVARVLRSRYGMLPTSFAAPIRAAVADILGLEPAELERTKDEVHPDVGVTPRAMMQTLGTEWGRGMVHKDLWLKSLALRMAKCHLPSSITDVRFENEADFVREKGGVIVHVYAPKAPTIDGSAHASEAGVQFRPDLGDVRLRNGFEGILELRVDVVALFR